MTQRGANVRRRSECESQHEASITDEANEESDFMFLFVVTYRSTVSLRLRKVENGGSWR